MTDNNSRSSDSSRKTKDEKFRLINKEVTETFNGVFAARDKIYDERNADVAVECLSVLIHVLAYLLEHATWIAKQIFGFNDDMINEIIQAARYGLTLEHLKGERKANLEFETRKKTEETQ
jgi:hypothetical protein